MVRCGGRDSDDALLEMAGDRARGALDADAEYCSGSADVHLRPGLAGAAWWHRVQHHREQAAAGRPHGAGVLAHRPLRLAGRCARSGRAGRHRLRRWWDVVADDHRVGNVESPWRPTCDTRRASAAAESGEICDGGAVCRVHAGHVLARARSFRCRGRVRGGRGGVF